MVKSGNEEQTQKYQILKETILPVDFLDNRNQKDYEKKQEEDSSIDETPLNRRQFLRKLFRVSLTGIACFHLPPLSVFKNFAIAKSNPGATPNTIINVHEHIESMNEVPKLLSAMDQTGIAKTVLVGSSWFTITLNQQVGFSRYEENNERLLKIIGKYPDRFEAWPTLDPGDSGSLEKLKDYIERGATGLKLYLGHGLRKTDDTGYFFHTMPLDSPEILPLYQFCQENFIPICYHLNPGPNAPGFAREFVNALKQFPDLKINCPHFMLSSIKMTRLREFLDVFPNLYTDTSFGHDSFLKRGLLRISRNPQKFKKLIHDYPDRFFFGTDVVVTSADFKDTNWIAQRCQAYIDMLTKSEYTTTFLPKKVLRGLALSQQQAQNILSRNFNNFMQKRPVGTEIAKTVDWSKVE